MVTQTVSPDLTTQPEPHHYTHLEASHFDQSRKVNKNQAEKSTQCFNVQYNVHVGLCITISSGSTAVSCVCMKGTEPKPSSSLGTNKINSNREKKSHSRHLSSS